MLHNCSNRLAALCAKQERPTTLAVAAFAALTTLTFSSYLPGDSPAAHRDTMPFLPTERQRALPLHVI